MLGGGGGWKKQIRAAANKGEMPSYIMGNREQQSEVFEYIDKVYSMPDTDARIVDQGESVWVNVNGKVYRAGYPSGENASEAEKSGVLKKVLYNAGEKGTSVGGSGKTGRFSVSAATKTLNESKTAFASGNPPSTITVNGIKMTGGVTGSYTSGGGYTVKTYKYTAESPIMADGRRSITFKATDYTATNGKKAKGYERDKQKIFDLEVTGAVGYSTGRSGGIR